MSGIRTHNVSGDRH